MFEKGLKYHVTVEMVTEICYKCSIAFGMPSDMKAVLLRDRTNFYCPNGHVQQYVGKSDAEKLKEANDLLELKRKQLNDEQSKRWEVEEKNRKLDAKLKRVHKGVCPCCNRSFENLRRHMETKHPEELQNFIKLINSKNAQEGIVVLNKLTQSEKKKLKGK